MNFFLDSFISAILLIRELDPQLVQVVKVSLTVSFTSTVITSCIAVPLGFVIAFSEFSAKRAVITLFNTLLALPTVVIGLFVYSFISRQGILGFMGLLYTKKAIVIGQVILITPVIATFTISAVSRIDERYRRTALTMGATWIQSALAVFMEARFAVMAAVVAGFGRVISEIGVSMMLGGNARGYTRTMTTAMALEYDKGEFVLAVALGIILLSISLGMNVLLQYFQGRYRG